MVRFITCLTFIFAFITLVSAQVTVINTPEGEIRQGANITVSWDISGPATQPGILEVINRDTKDTDTISDNLDLNAKSLIWTVSVVPGTYNFALNDGTGNKFSGPFTVVPAPAKAPASGPGPGPGPAPAPAPAPAPKGAKEPVKAPTPA